MTPEEFNQILSEQIIVIDGAMGTMVQNYDLNAKSYGGEDFQMLSDILVFSCPDVVKEIHLEYFKAGANAVETNTFGASPLRLQEFDFNKLNPAGFPEQPDKADLRELSIEELTLRLNRQAVEIAKQALDEYKASKEYDQRPLFVLGSIGPSNWVLSSTHADLRKATFEQIVENFYCQVSGLIDGGVDVLLFETQQDILELKAAVIGAKRAMREKNRQVAIIAQVTVDKFTKMQIFNTDIHAAMVTIQDIGIDVFGINCSIGPDLMLPTVKKISRYSKLPISIIPNAGLPQSEDGKTVFKLTPEEMAAHIETYISEYGVNIVGGCCGTSPAHISKVAEVAKGRKPLKRNIETGVFVSGPQNAIRLDSSESLIRIGERLNVRGSKKVRDAVEGQSPIDQDALEEVLKEQVKDLGLELVDVCMDSNLVNTADTMVEVIKAQTVDFPGAMVLDSFDVKALEKGIQAYPGRAIINSISLEEVEPGLDKIDAVARVTKEHAPVYIALTTDEKGPAVTAEQKFNLAQRIVDKAQREHGIKPEQIMIDINAFPIGAESVEGMNFAVESIKSIAKIKGIHPDLKTTIGVGNLTNGLANKPYMRKVLTSVFLDEARKEGLDAAIVNPNHYVPVDSLSKEDYQIGLKIVLEHDMDAFSRLEEIAEMKKGVAVKKKVQYIDLDPVESVCQKIKDGFKERETGSVMMDGMEFGYSDKIVTQVSEIIKGGMKPLDLINQHLMKAMQELGDGFAAGDVSLPHLLKSADVMKQVMGFLEDYMKRGTNEKDTSPKKKGVVVLGTVYQDVHSIGKDLAKTLLENYGFTVIDLGVQVPLQSFIDSAKEHQADIVGMSALLVQTSNHMITLSSMMTEQGFEDTPILIGGAPVNHRHAAYVAMAGIQDENQMKENVFYCNSAMDGVNIINSLMDKEKKSELCKANKKKLLTAFQAGKKRQVQTDELLKTLPRRKVDFSISPTFEGAFPPVQTLSFSMSEFYPHLDQKMLFSLNWRYGGKKSQEKRGVSNQELRDKLLNWINKIDERRWITPLAAYGLFYCKGNGNKVTVFHPETKKEIGCFEFNDVIGEGKKDIFNAAEFYNSDRLDVIGIQISTAGINSEKAIGAFKDEKDQESAWDLQGLSDRVAEDMANLANQRLESLFFGEKKAKSARYSPGYPAMSDISNNQLIFDLLNAKELLQMQITKGFEFVPTSSTGAVVCFHPFAGYR